jgi:phospholipid/cholesterol/gamma-HCH transport system permease protein
MTGMTVDATASAGSTPTAARSARSLLRRAHLVPIAWLGRTTRRSAESAGRATRYAVETARSAADVSTWRPELAGQMLQLGVHSLPIALFIALFTGIVLALLASYSFTGAVPLYFVGTLVEKTITMELAPVLTGLALAGRVGASIAAEIGTMKVTEQIDALEILTFDPHAYLVVPRALAGAITFPLVVGLAMIVGVGAGWVASVVLLDLASAEFVKGLRLFFDSFDVRYGMVKASSFGAAITLLACRAGMEARGGAQGVGRATKRAVVHGAIAVLVLDAMWAMTWLLGRVR